DRFGPARPVVWTGYHDALDMFDGHVYAGGAARLFMLMRMLGDQKFWNTTQGYLNDRAFTSINTDQFFDTWSKYSGVDLHPFEKQWIMTSGTPRLTLTKD